MTTADDILKLLSPDTTWAGQLQMALLVQLAEHQRAGTIPTNGQFLWYELESLGIVDKEKRRGRPGVKRGQDQDLSDALLHLREQGIIPWGWISDETRQTYSYIGARSIADAVTAYVDAATLDPWGDDGPPLILCESRSLAGTLQGLAEEYRCLLAATNGQTNGYVRTDLVQHIDADTYVFYLGDLDLSGGQIEANTRRVLTEASGVSEQQRMWKRLAITQRQVRSYSLQDKVITRKDGRHKRRDCCGPDGPGHSAIETEALGQERIVSIVRRHLDAMLAEDLADVHVREERQRAQITAQLDGLDREDDR